MEGRLTETEREREREICLFILQMATTVMTRSDQNQKPGSHLGLSCGLLKLHVLEPSSPGFLGPLARGCVLKGVPGMSQHFEKELRAS